MLVLEFKVGEQVQVGRTTATVLAVKGGRVSLGFEGPEAPGMLRDSIDRTAPPRSRRRLAHLSPTWRALLGG